MPAEKTSINASQINPNIGAVINEDRETLLSGIYASEIRALLEDRGVLVFPKVDFTDEEQNAFTQTLGTQALEYNGANNVEGAKRHNVFKVSLDPDVNPVGASLKTSFYWHLDGSMHEFPILASILCAKHMPPEGGATEFCNTYAAYDALSEDEKKELEGLRVVHANWALQRYINPEPTYERFCRSRDIVPSKSQPIVWNHKSGRKSLVIGSTAAYVEGWSLEESMDLLIRLRDWATQPQFVYRHEWTVGDAVMWDNTGTLHRAMPYEADSGRLLHRTMLKGEEAIA